MTVTVAVGYLFCTGGTKMELCGKSEFVHVCLCVCGWDLLSSVYIMLYVVYVHMRSGLA